MRWFNWFLLVFVGLTLLWVNTALYRPNYQGVVVRDDIKKQLNFLEDELKNNRLGEKMQAIYPEGYVFIYALYGLSQAEISLDPQANSTSVKEALAEAVFAFDKIDQKETRYTFSPDMSPAYGIYYQGWRNYLLAKILSNDLPFDDRARYESLFSESCDLIAQALKNAESPFLPSYPDQAWPADSFLAMASLSLHDQHYPPQYKQDIQRWIEQVRVRLDKSNGMIPHKTFPETGKTLEPPRGGSMALMLRLLAEIDDDFASDQFQLFRANFSGAALGLPMVREYPHGNFGLGDIDSGPVILGTGFAATIVSIGTYQVFGQQALAERQFRTVHAFGLSQSNDKTRTYLLGALPMADAFIVWSRLAPGALSADDVTHTSAFFWKFHGLSLIIILLIALPLYKRKIRGWIRKVSPQRS